MKTTILNILSLVIVLGLISFLFIMLIELKREGISELIYYKSLTVILSFISIILILNKKK